jgi:hypothetical protein
MGVSGVLGVYFLHTCTPYLAAPVSFKRLLCSGRVYLPMRIKAPAAMATIAKKVPSPEKLILSRGMSPVRMSQMPNKSIPRFLVTFINFIERLL